MSLSIFPYLARSRLVNVTVDDSGADPLTGATFAYAHNWSQGGHCSQCSVKLDSSQVHSGTWHDATYNWAQFGDESITQTASLSFNG